MNSTLEIREKPLSELRPAPYNPRQRLEPGDSAYDKLATSLREFGLVEPLIWNETTGHVVGGHLRLRILHEMGVTAVPVSVVHLDPIREKALNVVLNNREAQGRFDSDKLAELLHELKDAPALVLTGFDRRDLPALHLAPRAEIETEPIRDDVEATLTIPRAHFESVSPRLEALVAEFDLRCHIRR